MQGLHKDQLTIEIRRIISNFTTCHTSGHDEKNHKALQEFLELATNIDPELGERILADNSALWDRRTLLSTLYAQHLQKQEFLAAQTLVEDVARGNDFRLKSGGQFAENAYNRVEDMFEHCDFSSCQRFVMVGCGPLPVTMLQVLNHTNLQSVLGIDCNQRAVEVARKLFQAMKEFRATVIQRDGQNVAYSNTDLIYIANMCSPKIAILDAIESVAVHKMEVVVREPISLGRLLAENVENDISSKWHIAGRGKMDKQFLSRHLFLQWKG